MTLKNKAKFNLIKDVPNIINLSQSAIDSYSIEDSIENLIRTILLTKGRAKHFTSNRIFELVSKYSDTKKNVDVVYFPKYFLPITYNKQTKKIIINTGFFATKDITTIDSKTVYSCLVYGLCFRDLVEGKNKISDIYFSSFTNFIATIFIRVFGKQYGLLGAYVSRIPKLKFLVSCYILQSFFDISGSLMYKKALSISSYDYSGDIKELSKYDFNNIEDLILSFSELKVMPGITRYSFATKILKFLSINFLVALEDGPRFISSILVSNIANNGIIPTFIYSYNVPEFNKIITLAKKSF
jgi:hypothetical protein